MTGTAQNRRSLCGLPGPPGGAPSCGVFATARCESSKVLHRMVESLLKLPGSGEVLPGGVRLTWMTRESLGSGAALALCSPLRDTL